MNGLFLPCSTFCPLSPSTKQLPVIFFSCHLQHIFTLFSPSLSFSARRSLIHTPLSQYDVYAWKYKYVHHGFEDYNNPWKSLGDKVKVERKDRVNQSYLFICQVTLLFKKCLLIAMGWVLFLELGMAWDMEGRQKRPMSSLSLHSSKRRKDRDDKQDNCRQ